MSLTHRIAKLHRANPHLRESIEGAITDLGMWDQFRWGDEGRLLAKMTAERQARINGASVRIRERWGDIMTPQMREMSGWGLPQAGGWE